MSNRICDELSVDRNIEEKKIIRICITNCVYFCAYQYFVKYTSHMSPPERVMKISKYILILKNVLIFYFIRLFKPQVM